jgi:hypothetical protein
MPSTPENKRERSNWEKYPQQDNAAARRAAAEKLAKLAVQKTVNKDKPKK